MSAGEILRLIRQASDDTDREMRDRTDFSIIVRSLIQHYDLAPQEDWPFEPHSESFRLGFVMGAFAARRWMLNKRETEN